MSMKAAPRCRTPKIALAGDSLVRLRFAAAAGGLDVGVGDLEAGAIEPFDIVDLGAEESGNGSRFHMDLNAMRCKGRIGRLRLLRIVQNILKPAATGSLVAKAKVPSFLAIFSEDLFVLFRSAFCHGNRRRIALFLEDPVELFDQFVNRGFGKSMP